MTNQINFKVRFRNPVFIVQIILAILTPILAYAGLTMQDITSWATLGNLLLNAISNPYVLGLVAVSVWNAVNDPTTRGVYDGVVGMSYDEPSVNYDEFDDDVADDVEEDFTEEEIEE